MAKPNERDIVYIDTDGPFPYYDVAPETVEASADDISATGGTVESTASKVDAMHSTARVSVQGVLAGPMVTAPEPVRANMTQVMQAALFGGGSVRLFGSAVRTFNGGITKLNEEYATAAANDFGVARASTTGTPAEELMAANEQTEAVSEARATALSGLMHRYLDLRSRLDADATHTAGMLDRGPNEADIKSLWTSGSLSLAAVEAFPTYNLGATPLTELPPELRGRSDEDLARYALEHPELATTLLPVLNEHTKQLIGADLAHQGQTLGDTFDERKDGFQAEMDAFNKVLAAYGGDAVVATSFLNTIGPRGLLELNGRITTSAADALDGYPGEDATKSYANSIAALQKTLGVVLATGTSGQPTTYDWSGEGTATYVSADWTNQLITEGQNKIGLMGNGTDQEVIKVYGFQLLAPLLANGDHSPQFLSSVGGSMLSFEQQFAADHNGHLPWELSRPMMADGLRLDWTHGFKDQDPAGWDPMTGLMRGLSADPEASRDFFAGAVTGGEPPRYPRVDYLLTDRNWMVDRAWNGHGPDVTGISELGDALKTATTVDPDGDSVRIVESIVHELAWDEEAHGYENGDVGQDGDEAKPFEESDVVDPALRGALGDILGDYINSVHQAMADDPRMVGPDANGDWDPVLPGIQTLGARFDTHELSMVLADLGKDEGAHATLVERENIYAALSYDHYLSGVTDPNDIAAQAGRVSNVSGSVLGALDYGASAAHHQTTADADKEHNDNVEQGFKFVNAVLGKIPTDKVPLAGDIIDELSEAAEESMKQDHTGDTNYDIGASLTQGKAAQQMSVEAAIYHNMPASALPPELQSRPDPASWTPEQQSAWRSFLRDTGQWSAEIQDAKLNGGQDYTNGYTEAQQRLDSWRK